MVTRDRAQHFGEKGIDMSNGAIWGLIGGIAGGIIGLAGGGVGTWFSIRNAEGPRERSFIIRSAVVFWIAMLLFITLFFVLPEPYRWFMWVPYSILFPLGIIYVNRRYQAIRRKE